jgi:hypothetical protein
MSSDQLSRYITSPSPLFGITNVTVFTEIGATSRCRNLFTNLEPDH